METPQWQNSESTQISKCHRQWKNGDGMGSQKGETNERQGKTAKSM